MEEQTWLDSRDPAYLHHHLSTIGMDAHCSRQMRLFAVACCRRLGPLLTDPRSRAGLEIAERFADNHAGLAELSRAASEAYDANQAVRVQTPLEVSRRGFPGHYATLAVWWSLKSLGSQAYFACGCVQQALAWQAYPDAGARAERQVAERAEAEVQAVLFRDVIGNPFRPLPVIEESWLTWNEATVRRMAEAIYRERGFGDLPVLADALAEAGCTAEDLLEHLRSPELHTRGCWILDLLLAKE